MEKSTELQRLIRTKSYIGIIDMLATLGVLLIVIGVLCPICNYNPTVFDETRRDVFLQDLSYITVIAEVLLVAAIIISFVCCESFIKTYSTGKDWKVKARKYCILAGLVFIFVLISVLIIETQCTSYKIPEESFQDLEIKQSSGFYLIAIGGLILAASFAGFSALVYELAKGKVDMDDIIWVNKNNSSKEINTKSSLSDKLNELQTLKETGVITEEEYLSKKEELLREFK